MKTKIQIIQQLLDDRKINAEEAMVLMEKEYIYYPQYPSAPYIPWYPNIPHWQAVTNPAGATSADFVITTN
jgi:hypothetical protein